MTKLVLCIQNFPLMLGAKGSLELLFRLVWQNRPWLQMHYCPAGNFPWYSYTLCYNSNAKYENKTRNSWAASGMCNAGVEISGVNPRFCNTDKMQRLGSPQESPPPGLVWRSRCSGSLSTISFGWLDLKWWPYASVTIRWQKASHQGSKIKLVDESPNHDLLKAKNLTAPELSGIRGSSTAKPEILCNTCSLMPPKVSFLMYFRYWNLDPCDELWNAFFIWSYSDTIVL